MKLRAHAISRDDLSELISLKQEAIKVLQEEQKEDVKRLEQKLDKVLDYLRCK